MAEGVLIIQRVKKEDEGMYECRASNDKGAVASSAVVRVVGETRLLRNSVSLSRFLPGNIY